jgi:glycosyltransferase involved in cell wall biosynthesis
LYGPLLAVARELRIPVVYDTDDLLFRVSPEHPDYAVYQAKSVYALQALLDGDCVVASTPELASHLMEFHSQVSVLPNRLPAALWRPVYQQRQARSARDSARATTIGYVGSRTHQPDLESIADVLANVLDRQRGRVRFLSVGVPLPRRLRRHPQASVLVPPKKVARDYGAFAAFAAALEIDIGIAPLLDSSFNRCKSDIKFQEYAALGIPGVYSDLPPYRDTVRHGETGFLASSLEQWQTHLEHLVGQPAVRRQLAESAAREMSAQWNDPSAQTEGWRQVIDRARCLTASGNGSRPAGMAPVIRELAAYQNRLERQLKKTVEYQVSKCWQRLLRKLAA